MKVLLAGADGALGRPLTHQLIAHDHLVCGLAHTAASASRLAALGATPVMADALDRDGLLRALDGLSADAVVNELTALQGPRRASGMVQTNRLRREAPPTCSQPRMCSAPSGS